jgi:hypothetical protein
MAQVKTGYAYSDSWKMNAETRNEIRRHPQTIFSSLTRARFRQRCQFFDVLGSKSSKFHVLQLQQYP